VAASPGPCLANSYPIQLASFVVLFEREIVVALIILFRALYANKLVSEHWFVLPCFQPSFVVVLLMFVRFGLFPRCAYAQPSLGDSVLVSFAKTR
jgi:hypothetical protein